MTQKILKTAGYCTDGCQWQYCSFLFRYTNADISNTTSHCKLFGDTEIYGGKSLKICDKIYGSEYDGEV